MENVGNKNVTEAIGHDVVDMADRLNIKTIICLTVTGYTANVIAKNQPKANILAITSRVDTRRKLDGKDGITAVLTNKPENIDQMLDHASSIATETNMAKSGDLVLIVSGYPINQAGATNFIKVQLISKTLAKGQGIGKDAIFGKAYIAKNADDANKNLAKGDILIAKKADADYLPAVKNAKAIITETGGLTSYIAVMGMSLGIPVVVGAQGATKNISTGDLITVDAHRGIAFKGMA